MSRAIYSREALEAALGAGASVEYLHFWGHTGKGKACLSQWYPAAFEVEGERFPTAEHYMMHRKALLFGDRANAQRMLTAASPSAVKAPGRAVESFDEQVWERERFEIVVAGNRAKFAQHDELREFLRNTGRRILVEASPTDRVWGIGLAASDPRASQPLEWHGLNLLGFALMKVRDELAG